MLNLKCENIDSWGCYLTKKRWIKTRNFIARNYDHNKDNRIILDIGPENIFGKQISNYFSSDYYHTEGDLNYPYWNTTIDSFRTNNSIDKKWKAAFGTICCFEVLEHLMNPLLFLNKLHSICDKDTKIFLSYPYNPLAFMWSDTHFHEYNPDRFNHLLKESKFKIIAQEQYKIYWKVKDYLKGFSPLLRLAWLIIGYPKQNLYYLKIK